jgi:hypothetical protein
MIPPYKEGALPEKKDREIGREACSKALPLKFLEAHEGKNSKLRNDMTSL